MVNTSILYQIANGEFKSEEAQEQREKLLNQGFTILNDEKTPFDNDPAPAPPSDKPAKGKNKKAQQLIDHAGRFYGQAYRAAFDYHERHNPPFIDAQYWHDHKPGIDDTPPQELAYWDQAIADLSATAGKDSFLQGLLSVVYNELEREYETLRAAAACAGHDS